MFFTEAVVGTSGVYAWLVPALVTLAGAFSVAYSLRLIHDTFFNGPPKDLPNMHPHEPPLGMKLPAMLLVTMCIVVGLLPAVTFGPLVHVSATALVGQPLPEYHLAIWHGFNLPLVLSFVALAGGVGLYVVFGKRINANPRGGPWGWKRLNGGWLFERTMTGLFKGSEALVRLFGAWRATDQVEVFGEVQNLFDETYNAEFSPGGFVFRARPARYGFEVGYKF